jgi:heat shock protein HtpX
VNVVEEMAIAGGVPRPRIWIVPDEDQRVRDRTGSFGRTRRGDGGIAGDAGSRRTQAVIAHELGHVKNLYMRLMTLLAALVGAVALVGDFHESFHA